MKRIFLYIILTICSLKVSAADFTFKEGDIVFRSGKNYPVMYISASTITHSDFFRDLELAQCLGTSKH